MAWLIKWPKCMHLDLALVPVTFVTWRRGQGERAYGYQQGKCRDCGRPVIKVDDSIPANELTGLRRHAAWTYLDKEGEHAGNTLVLRRG